MLSNIALTDRFACHAERVSELEGALIDVQAQLNEQEEEAETAIAKWQESCSSLQEQNGKLVHKIETSNDVEGSMQQRMEETQRALEEAKKNLKADEDAIAKWQGMFVRFCC